MLLFVFHFILVFAIYFGFCLFLIRCQCFTYLPILWLSDDCSNGWQQWLMMCLIGFAVGLIGFFLHQTIDLIADFKWKYAKDLLKQSIEVKVCCCNAVIQNYEFLGGSANPLHWYFYILGSTFLSWSAISELSWKARIKLDIITWHYYDAGNNVVKWKQF